MKARGPKWWKPWLAAVLLLLLPLLLFSPRLKTQELPVQPEDERQLLMSATQQPLPSLVPDGLDDPRLVRAPPPGANFLDPVLSERICRPLPPLPSSTLDAPPIVPSEDLPPSAALPLPSATELLRAAVVPPRMDLGLEPSVDAAERLGRQVRCWCDGQLQPAEGLPQPAEGLPVANGPTQLELRREGGESAVLILASCGVPQLDEAARAWLLRRELAWMAQVELGLISPVTIVQRQHWVLEWRLAQGKP